MSGGGTLGFATLPISGGLPLRKGFLLTER
jgi:hypothetical protein